jgi:tetratricopeptide (TPR) repeat protein
MLPMRKGGWSAVALFCVVVGSFQPVAHADNKPVAKEAYTEGKRQYDLGEFEQALAAFKKAYLNYEEPVFLFNIAQCYRQLGDRASAVRTYKAFLRNWPKAPNRDIVERIIADLETAIAKDQSVKAAPPHETLPPPKPGGEVARTETRPKPTPTEPGEPTTRTPPSTTQPQPETPAEPAKVAKKPAPAREYTSMVEVEPNFEKPSGKAKPLKWWHWTLIVVGVGAAVGAGVAIGVTQSKPAFESTLPDFTVMGSRVHPVEVRF